MEVEHFRKDTEAVLKRLPLWSGALEALESLPLAGGRNHRDL